MSISNYLATSIRLSVLMFVFLLFSCGSPTATSVGEVITPTPTGTEKPATPTPTIPPDTATPTTSISPETNNTRYFSYTIRVSDRNTQEPIQDAEASIRLGEELFESMMSDPRGQVVFTFELDKADRGIKITVKAEGYEEQTFNSALKPNSPPEDIQLSPTSSPLLPTDIPAPIETPTSTPTVTPTILPTDTPTLTPTSTPTNTPMPSSPTPTPTLATPTGNLAIPVVFNFGTRVYLTGFNGTGINGPNEVFIGGALGSEDARQPMFSRDGKSVMVKATLGGVIGLHKLTASGFNPEIIIRRGSAEWPILSPDGQTVMFSEATLDYRLHKRLPSNAIETDDEIIEEVFLDGLPIFAKNLLWSEDNQLVFHGCAVWKNSPSECGTWITNANNLNPQRIVEGNYAQPMAIRNDLLAYMLRQSEQDWDIYLMSLNNGETINLTDNDFEDGLPAISPDGNMVAYISNESGNWGLWTVNLDGQNKQHWFDIDTSKGVFNIDEWSSDRMSWRR